MRHVILGNGPAGVIAAAAIRRHKPDEAGTYLRKGVDHYPGHRIALRCDRARAVDAAARTVTLQKGGQLPFDRLLIATGSQPAKLPIPGADLAGVHPCWTLADARRIAQRAVRSARVLQIGAGFIGCIILEALANRGVSLTVVEMGDRMVPRMMGQGAGGMIKRWVQSKGIKVHTSTRVEAIEPGPSGALTVRLSNGERVVSDQVMCAAMNMIDRPSTLKCVTQINVLDTLGLISSSFGNWEGVAGGDHAERQDERNFRFIRLEFDGDALVGANTIGLTEHVGVIRGLIQSRVPLGHWKNQLMADPLALSEAYLSTAQAQASWGLKAA